MFDRTITVDSMGKTFSVTGWKIGWAIAPAPLTAALRAVHQFVTFTNGTPFQEALADILSIAAREGYYDKLRGEYRHRRELLTRALKGADLAPLPVEGAYFLLTDVSGRGFGSDADFCRRLVTEFGVAAIPTSAFYADPHAAPALARFCFAKKEETIAAAAPRLTALAGLRVPETGRPRFGI
jgi:aspartate/methionine/tyrosine aminotransferase